MACTRERAHITFGSQMGDTKSDDAVGPHLLVLGELLGKYSRFGYASELDKFYIIFRVDGDIWYWNLEGCHRLRLMRKYRYITVDIYVPRSKWQGASVLEIRSFLLDNLKKALSMMVAKLKKEHIDVDDKRLFEDFTKVEQDFLVPS